MVFGSGGDGVAYTGLSHFIKFMIERGASEAEKLAFDHYHCHFVSTAAIDNILESKNDTAGDLV